MMPSSWRTATLAVVAAALSGPSCGAPATAAAVAPKMALELPHAAPTATDTPLEADEADEADGPALPALYAPLFERGHEWQLRVDSTNGYWDGDTNQNVTKKAQTMGRCVVAEVVAVGRGVASHIECHDIPGVGVQEPLSGWWQATPTALYHPRDEPRRDAAELSPTEKVLDAAPRTSSATEPTGTEPDSGWKRDVTKSADGYCFEESSWGGDEGWSSVCFAEETGFASGTWGWAGGSTEENVFTVIR